MEEKSVTYDYSLLYYIEKINVILNENQEIINNVDNFIHYYCTSCHKFPFIKFWKDRKNIRLTCSCFNNKKILIEKLFKLNSNDMSLPILLSKTDLNNLNIEDEYMQGT